jgi:hypothetical protein
MVLATEARGLDTSDDWARWLVEAGFEQVHTVDLPAMAGTTLAVAQRSAS